MRAFTALLAASVCASPINASAAELFLFRAGDRSAITLEKNGRNLPAVPEGWKFVDSIGDHSHFMDEAGFARLSATGFEIHAKPKRSRSVAAWPVLPRGTLRITKRAAAQIKLLYETISRDGGRHVLSLEYGPVSTKDKNSTVWRDLGNRITLGAFPAADVPKAAFHRHDGVPLMFRMDLETLPTPRPTVIDYGPEGFVFGK